MTVCETDFVYATCVAANSTYCLNLRFIYHQSSIPRRYHSDITQEMTHKNELRKVKNKTKQSNVYSVHKIRAMNGTTWLI